MRGFGDVCFVVVTMAAHRDLARCLAALCREALAHPGAASIVVVDNSGEGVSTVIDEVRRSVAADEPAITVVDPGGNLGFAGGVNLAASSVDVEWLAVVNDDVELEPGWLEACLAQVDADRYRCVGSVVTDWAGERVDFVGGTLNLHGMGNQTGFGRPLAEVAIDDGGDLLFANGAAMLVDRSLFLELGGFDEQYFAYYEDVDFGWRLWTTGARVRLAGRARARHRHHGTSGAVPFERRLLLYERNALRTLIKNLEPANLGPVLASALLLLVDRARLDRPPDRSQFDLFAAEGAGEPTPPEVAVRLHAVGDVIDDLPGLVGRRREVQQRREVADAELFARFGRPFEPLGKDDVRYLEHWQGVTELFGLDRLFDAAHATNVLVVAYDSPSERMAGSAARSWELATELARSVPVRLAVQAATDRSAPGVTIVPWSEPHELQRAVDEADVIVVQGNALRRAPFLRNDHSVLVVDLYDPWVFENLEFYRPLAPEVDPYLDRDVSILNELLDSGDVFLCGSERQRDYWLGALTARNRLDRATYAGDPDLRRLVAVVPSGCPDEPPTARRPVLRGVLDGIGAETPTLVWTGGAWDWFDPLAVVDAFTKARESVPSAHLVFLGLTPPSADLPTMAAPQAVRRRIDHLGQGQNIHVLDWIPYDDRGGALLEADVGVVATKPIAERRLAVRSRLLDHLWAGLPTIATEGDELGHRLAEAGASVVVPCGDVDAMATAISDLLSDHHRRAAMAATAARLADDHRWSASIEPLVDVVREPWRWRRSRALRPRPTTVTETARLLLARRREHIEHLEAMVTELDDQLRAAHETVREQEAHLREARRKLDRLAVLRPAYLAGRTMHRRLRGAVAQPAEGGDGGAEPKS